MEARVETVGVDRLVVETVIVRQAKKFEDYLAVQQIYCFRLILHLSKETPSIN